MTRRHSRSEKVWIALFMGSLVLFSFSWEGRCQLARPDLQGTVRDQAARPVANAEVLLRPDGSSSSRKTTTDADGRFAFTGLEAGNYTLSAATAGVSTGLASKITLPGVTGKSIDLVLEAGSVAASANAGSPSGAAAMQFSDQPNFTIAGVTDWTAAGGHGSDSILRTSEDLTRETLALRSRDGRTEVGATANGRASDGVEGELRAALAASPGSFEANHRLGELYLQTGRSSEALPLLRAAYQIQPTDRNNEYELALAFKDSGEYALASQHVRKLLAGEDRAELHRLAGELAERSGDPLTAVREYEEAVHLEPSEQDYFEWGSELLLHRAIWQAQEVFKKGVAAYPKSSRLLSALGAALFAGDLYEEAAQRICEASDLSPADPDPYLFLGKIEVAAPNPPACAEGKLERFAKAEPKNSLANYFYAMAIWKRQGQPADPKDLQQVKLLLNQAVAADPNCGEAYLQLGIVQSAEQNPGMAIDYYKRAVEANPRLAEAHYRLGVAYDRAGRGEMAKQEFQLHDQIQKEQAAEVERKRREVKQFLVVMQGQAAVPPSH
jgi:tetratricopeptide (TPR) repeat protein